MMPYADNETAAKWRRDQYRKEHGIPLDAPVEQHRVFTTDDERREAKRERNRRHYAKKHGLTPEQVAENAAKRAMSEDERKAALKAKQAAYARAHYLKMREDPEYRAKKAAHTRAKYRRDKAIPQETRADLRFKYATEEERLAAKRLAKRKADAKKRGTTIEEIDARNAAREAAKIAKANRAEEDANQRAQRRAEAKAAAERAKRRAAPVVAKPTPEAPPAPARVNDPPELVALFKKASKGQPPLPYNPRVRKLSVWHLRGVL